MARRGAPTKYNPEFHGKWALSLARQGLTIKEIASEMGLGKTTVNRWMNEHPEFRDALNEGRAAADSRVEDTLYKLAIGRTVVKETKKRVVIDEDNNTEIEFMDITEKDVPPNTAACIFWLKNRRPDKWREKQIEEVTVTGTQAVIVLPEHEIEDED